MGWQDRNYNPGREDMNAYFSNPAALLQFSVPIYRHGSFYIRLHFWFLIFAIFAAVDVIRSHLPLAYIAIAVAVMFIAVILHELGHLIFARLVGGNHWEWVLWPLGGMVPPSTARRPWPVFVANIGGMAISVPLALASCYAFFISPSVHAAFYWILDPMGPLAVFPAGGTNPATRALVYALGEFCEMNVAIAVINLFPAYWFDGGQIWQSILWPKLGAWRATQIVCIAGMVLSAPLVLLSLFGENLLGMAVWALIFADCFNRRRALAAAGPGVMEEDEVTYNYMDTPEPRRKKHKKGRLRAARRKAVRDQAEQARIDAILDKVKIQGLHSLSWWEKRTLKRATERQRQRDLANRP